MHILLSHPQREIPYNHDPHTSGFTTPLSKQNEFFNTRDCVSKIATENQLATVHTLANKMSMLTTDQALEMVH